jgi:hypothetical protein
MISGAKVYHFVIVAKVLLTFLTLKFNSSDTLIDFYLFFLHFEIFHSLFLPYSLHIVILQKIKAAVFEHNGLNTIYYYYLNQTISQLLQQGLVS